MGIIRILENETPATPPVGKHTLWVSCETEDLKMINSDGDLTWITGMTGVANVNKIIEDGVLEGPGNGLPVEAPGQRYMFYTNTATGIIDSSWGIISGLQPYDIIERSADNTEWLIVFKATEAASGGFLAYNQFDNTLHTFNGTSWGRVVTGRSNITPVLTTNSVLTTAAVNRVSGDATHTLPDATKFPGETVEIKHVDLVFANILIQTSNGQLIDNVAGGDTFGNANEYKKYISDGANWLKLFN